VFAAAPDRSTILSSRLNQSKVAVGNVLTFNDGDGDPFRGVGGAEELQYELSAFYSVIPDVDGMKRPVLFYSLVGGFKTIG